MIKPNEYVYDKQSLREAVRLMVVELERIKKGNSSHDRNCVSELALGLGEYALASLTDDP